MKHLAACILLLSVTACASIGGLRTEPADMGVTREFQAASTTLAPLVRDILITTGFRINDFTEIEDPRVASGSSLQSWMVLGRRKSSTWSYGELVRVVITPQDAQTSLVQVITRRRAALNLTAKGDYSDEIFQQLEATLRLQGGSP